MINSQQLNKAKNYVQNAIESNKEEEEKRQQKGGKNVEDNGESQFKDNAINRMSHQMQETREMFGERNRASGLAHLELDLEKKDRMKQQQDLADMNHREHKIAENTEKAKNDIKPIHIKQTRRAAVQLMRNLYVFYDKHIEDNLENGKTMLNVVMERMRSVFP